MDAPAVASNGSASDDDVLMDPVLDYIKEMLMDEQMEDRICMQQECTAYQAIVNSFYEVLSEESSSSGGAAVAERMPSPDVSDDYSWIDNILVAGTPLADSSPSPWPVDYSTSTSSSDQDVKPWSLDSSSGGSPYSEDSPVYGPALNENESWNGDAFRRNAQSYAIVPPAGQDSRLLYLQNLHVAGVAPVDLGNGNIFLPESMPQSVMHVEESKVRRVRSEDLHYNARLHANGSVIDDGGFKRTISDNGLDKRTISRESLQQSQADHNGRFSDHHAANGAPIRDFGEAHGKKGHDQNNCGEATDSSLRSDDQLSFVKNEDLNAEKTAKIYGEWSPRDLAKKHRPKKHEAQSNGGGRKKSGRSEAVDLRGLLVSCAQVVAGNDLRRANEILQEIRQHASPHGSATQRLAHYFSEALMARLSGTGGRLYTAMSNNRPSAAKMLKAYHLMVEVCPFAKLAHFFANQSILKVAEGASRLHIVDYGILYGIQWPCLISALADRKGGPPFLRITGIEFPQPGLNPAERVEQTGLRLAEYARTYNVPFEYHAIASKWEDVEPENLNLKHGEVLVVNCIHRLRHLMDETVMSASPRRKVLSQMRSLNPDILLVAVLNAGFNAPFFVSRFREALYHFSSKFDMIDTTVGDSDNPQRLMIERECLGRDIINIVACEGPERVERPETYRQWQARIQRAGFEMLPLNPTVLSKARAVVKSYYHKDFGVDDDSEWMLLGWKGRIVDALAAWKPSADALSK